MVNDTVRKVLPRSRQAWQLLLLLVLLPLTAWAGQKPATTKPTNEECLACHGDATLSKEVDGKPFSLYVDPAKYSGSIHGGMFACVDCHTDLKSAAHDSTPAKVQCATCHADEQKLYEQSFHAKAIQAGDRQAATCTSCHGSPHELLPASDPQSKVNHANVAATCGVCHSQKFVMDAGGQSTQPFSSYEQSVHGKAVAAGSDKAAVCTDCHGAHDILAATDPKSSIFKFNVPATCAKCHGPVKEEFMQSIHGQAIARGNSQAPVCTDCHGIHSIKSHGDPNSSVSAQNLAKTTCARCHEGVRLSQEFGLDGNRATTYLASYHGLASKLGSQVVANCASCHGVHNILPSSDPRSTISRANLVKTCGQCHPGINEKFVAGRVHINAPLSADTGSVAVRWVRKFYLGMIFVVIGAMLLHNFLIWRRKTLLLRRAHGRMVVRMETSERYQHAILFISFTVLVLTGFALKFPDSWFASLLSLGERVRGISHRVAAVVLIAVGAYHTYYVVTARKGRRLFLDLLPTPQDVRDVWAVMRYYLGLTDTKPVFARFNYAEKAEYWALVWGLFVMAGTGLMLWAKVTVSTLVPRWWLDVATAVHLYEAILATLAIIVWHFYQVFFDPDVYPMNWAWWDGKMSFDHYSEEHALDTETLLRAAEREKLATDTVVEESGAHSTKKADPQADEDKTGELTATRP